MSVAVVTGAAGLIGSQAVTHFASIGLDVVGVDNDMRRVFFGDESSTAWMVTELEETLGDRYRHADVDIRDRTGIDALFAEHGSDISLVIHTAAQPSHDWAAREPFTDFDVNAVGTLNVLEATRQHCGEATFIFTSTNKVYGDTPNLLPLVEHDTRWEIDPSHTYVGGIREDMSIDATLHSIFGASKVAADVMVQEYGRYFGMHTSVFRGGTLTGPNHAAAELHGFLAYVMQCTMTGTPYRVFGYQGKQVRDAIHSADLISCFRPRVPRRPGRSAALWRGLQHRRRAILELQRDRSDLAVRRDHGKDARLDLCRRQPCWRSHLVDRRQRPFRRALPVVGTDL